MCVDPQVGGEPGRLPLPVADQRHRAQQQRRPGVWISLSFKGFHGQQLDGLAEAHVVGQATAQPQRGQERQPRQATSLVRAQRGGEAVRWIKRLERLRCRPAEQVAQPAVRVHRGDRQRSVEVVGVAGGQREDLCGGLPTVGFAGQELQPATQLFRVDRHPLTAEPNQRSLGLGERGDLVLGQGLVVDGELPAELDELVATELALLAHHAVDRGVRRQRQPQPATPVPPGRQQHPEAGLVELRSHDREEPVRVVGVQVQLGRARGTQTARELGVDLAGPAELGQQQLLRAIQPAPQTPVLAPRLLGRHQQARILGGLQQELQPPARAGIRRRRFLDLSRRLGQRFRQPERRPSGPDPAGADVRPRPQRLGQRVEVAGVGVEPPVRDRQRGEPRFGGRRALRPPATSRRQQIASRRGQHGTRGRVHQLAQRQRGQLVRILVTLLARLGPAHRRHRGGQGVHRDDVRPPQHWTPVRHGAVPVTAQRRQHSPTPGELTGEGGQVAEEGEGRAVPHVRHRLLEHGQGGRRVHAHHWHRPGQQDRIRLPRAARCDPDQLRRVQRCHPQRRQQQRCRAGLAGMNPREHAGGRGERMRPRRTQRLAGALHRAVGVLRPEAQTVRGGPEAMQDQHSRTSFSGWPSG